MTIFSKNASVVVWGPTASVKVKVDALGNIVGDSWLLTNMSLGAREIVDVRQCFSDVSYIYALGNNQSSCTMTLTFAVFIGKKKCLGGGNTRALQDGMERYESNRISKKLSPASITIGSFSRTGWLVGIDMGNLDPLRGICYATVHFIVELKK